ncbi:hypothetical protein BQ8482_100264 [Mesorhizobium delmotii]|uniref:Uncharacterized protein n=1 Tax=Mesorhizobium delmotii TaxID=1631247 RepID=A0A2P9AAB0_9HYPH|nr:hypothetical protein BQ8482_100264 [Mesorhizobium delmotii]
MARAAPHGAGAELHFILSASRRAREVFKMKFTSYWHDTSKAFAGATREPLSGDFEVAVIGGGLHRSQCRAQTGQVWREGRTHRGRACRIWCIGAQWRAPQQWSLRQFWCGQGALWRGQGSSVLALLRRLDRHDRSHHR